MWKNLPKIRNCVAAFLAICQLRFATTRKNIRTKNHTLEVSEVSLEGTYKTVPAIAVSDTNSLLPVDLENEGLIHAISCPFRARTICANGPCA